MASMTVEEAFKLGLRESLKVRFKERRNKIEIMVDILSVARDEAKKTEIVYGANLNFNRVMRYLPFLEKRGLIADFGGVYKTTEKGEKFLYDYQKMQNLLSV